MHVSRAWAVKRGGCRRHERAAEPMLEWLFVFSVVVCVCVCPLRCFLIWCVRVRARVPCLSGCLFSAVVSLCVCAEELSVSLCGVWLSVMLVCVCPLCCQQTPITNVPAVT